MSQSLLPNGCYDLLPPHARQESVLSYQLLEIFHRYGYEQVSPPLLEFSDHLLSGRGADLSEQIFRVMDPAALKVMGIRPDITLQIARIAGGRLADVPRPLRLCYDGMILRMKAQGIKSERQFRQVGIELMGTPHPDADAEVIMVAAQALKHIGIDALCIDISLPTLAQAVIAESKLSDSTQQSLLLAIQQKDISAVRSHSFAYQALLLAMMQLPSNAPAALAAIESMAIPDVFKAGMDDLVSVTRSVLAQAPASWQVTLDITEVSAMNYHSGPCFSFFLPDSSLEIGRGGRYTIEHESSIESATGFTLYVDTVQSSLPPQAQARKILVAQTATPEEIQQLHCDGYLTLRALSGHGDLMHQAAQLGCEAVFAQGKLQPRTGHKS
ncbi:MAG: ATP phosphoribosyltransferase regulatory subunit [Alphaproteobacteria bacterium]|nr:ATP phosphoribosyltransferase regulatory subunit [Alphaproteobacteria bacterium]